MSDSMSDAASERPRAIRIGAYACAQVDKVEGLERLAGERLPRVHEHPLGAGVAQLDAGAHCHRRDPNAVVVHERGERPGGDWSFSSAVGARRGLELS